MTKKDPTSQTYAELQHAYSVFNRLLFNGQLPPCMLTLQREKRSVGYFSAARFGNTSGHVAHEIALNPSYFAIVPLVESLQTLAHEMVHLWQHVHGTPGRGRYHNEEFAAQMEAIGLMPSSTGKPGGRRTGDHMADFPITGGRFLQACEQLLTEEFTLSWYDRFPPHEPIDVGHHNAVRETLPAGVADAAMSVAANAGVAISPIRPVRQAECAGETAAPGAAAVVYDNSKRRKYTCSCEPKPHAVWGKAGLAIRCEKCLQLFNEVS